MKRSHLLTCSLLSALFYANSSHALVDYSESVGGGSAKSVQRASKPSESASSSKGLTWKADYSFTTNYEAMKIDDQKYGMLNFGAHVQTPFNIYVDASYWTASGDAGSSNGNPKLIVGFNWLRFGSASDEARLNLYGGVKLSSSSTLGSSRMDKIVGVETTKRFGTFGLGIGYDMTLTGTPSNTTEHAIGNISRITVSGGWIVSNDIQFEVEAENFTIKASDEARSNRLREKASFSTLSPKLNLSLAPVVNLEMGARFRMKKAKEETNLMAARVFDLHGVHTNSLFAGLNITL